MALIKAYLPTQVQYRTHQSMRVGEAAVSARAYCQSQRQSRRRCDNVDVEVWFVRPRLLNARHILCNAFTPHVFNTDINTSIPYVQ